MFGCGTHVVIGDEPRAGGDDAKPPAPAPAPAAAPGDPVWSEAATLSLDGQGSFDAMAGTATRLVLGAAEEGSALGPVVGAAYVFERQGDVWVRGQRLQSARPTAYASFGARVAVHDDLIVVGDVPARDAVLHVFALRDGFWTEVGAIPSPFPGSRGYCSGLVLTADTLAVGTAAGLSLFARSGESFHYVRTIPGDGNNYPTVAGSDKIIAVRTDGRSPYAIVANGGAWGEPIPLGPVLWAGAPLAVDGTRVAVGYPGFGPSRQITVYDVASGSGVQIAQITSDAPGFGETVALRGDRLVTNGHVLLESKGWAEEILAVPAPSGVGASMLGSDEMFSQVNGGVVRVKLGEPSATAQLRALQRLTASETTSNPGISSFGDHVSVGGDVAVVDAPERTEAPVPSRATSFRQYGTRSAYLFERRSGTWQFKQTLAGMGPCVVTADGATTACQASTGGVQILGRGPDGVWRTNQTVAAEKMVLALALENERLALAIYQESLSDPALLVYERISGTWSERHRSPLVDTDVIVKLAIGPSLVAIGTRPSDQNIGGGQLLGSPDSVRAYARTPAGEWAAAGTVMVGDTSDPRSRENVVDIAVSDERAVVLRRRTVNLVGPGQIDYQTLLTEYARKDAGWTSTASATLPPSIVWAGGATSLAHAGQDWMVGLPGDGTGSVTPLARTDGGFALGAKWTDAQASGYARFGFSLAASASTRVVGEPGHDRVRIFERTPAKSVR